MPEAIKKLYAELDAAVASGDRKLVAEIEDELAKKFA